MGEIQRLEEAFRRRESVEQTLALFASRFVGSLDVDHAIHQGLEDLGKLSGASRVYMFRLHDSTMDNTHEWCAPGVEPQKDTLQGLPVDSVPWWMAALRRGEAVHVRNVSTLPPEASAEREILEAQQIRSTIAFPVRVAGVLVGFVGLDNVERAEAWSSDDLRLLELASSILGSALQREEAERERLLADMRFRLLVEQNPLSIQVLAPDGRTLRVNAAWERLWGMRLVDLGDYNILHDEQLRSSGAMEPIERAFKGEASRVPPIPYAPDRGALQGRTKWVGAVAYAVKDEDGQVQEVVLMHEDVTQRIEAEEEIAASRRQLAATEKLSALGALVSGVAHEVRTPLAYIANNLTLIETAYAREVGAPMGPKLRERLAAAHEGVARINALVGDLRTFTRLPVAERVEADLARVVTGAVQLFRATHRGQVELVAELESTPVVHVVPEQVQQVVLNLLANAAEAMQDRGRIVVRTRRSGGDGAEIVVEDPGPGIPKEVEARLYEPFFTTKPEGTGLGLSISRRLVLAHGGTIRHEARPEGGTRFVVRLPLAGEPSAQEPVG